MNKAIYVAGAADEQVGVTCHSDGSEVGGKGWMIGGEGWTEGGL